MASSKNDLPKSSEDIFGGTNLIPLKAGESPAVDAASAFNRELEELQSTTRLIEVDKKNSFDATAREALSKLVSSSCPAELNLPENPAKSAKRKSPPKSSLCPHGKRNNGYLCLQCPGKGICEHKKQKYSCKVCKAKRAKKRKQSMINQFSDLSPINRPMNPMQAAAGIVNALSFFNTAPGSNNILPDLVQTDQKSDNDIGVSEIMSAMVRAIEHCHLKAQGVNFGIVGALSLPAAQVGARASQKYARGRGEGRVEIIETGKDGKKKRKYRYLCKHGKNKYFCKPCGGSMICEHGKQRHYCATCRANNRHSTKLIKKQREVERQAKLKSQSIDDMLPLPSAVVQEGAVPPKLPDLSLQV